MIHSTETAHQGRAKRAAIFSGLALGCVLWSCGPEPSGLAIFDLEGRPVDPWAGGRPVAFLFVRTDCPISNRYAPEIRRLVEAFSEVGFFLVYPDEEEPVDAIRSHLEDYGFKTPVLRDLRQTLTARTGATVTPEAAVFDADRNLVYRGRIDDRWVAFGKSRAEPTSHDLRDVLEALASGRRLEPRTTEAIGCFIPSRS